MWWGPDGLITSPHCSPLCQVSLPRGADLRDWGIGLLVGGNYAFSGDLQAALQEMDQPVVSWGNQCEAALKSTRPAVLASDSILAG